MTARKWLRQLFCAHLWHYIGIEFYNLGMDKAWIYRCDRCGKEKAVTSGSELRLMQQRSKP